MEKRDTGCADADTATASEPSLDKDMRQSLTGAAVLTSDSSTQAPERQVRERVGRAETTNNWTEAVEERLERRGGRLKGAADNTQQALLRAEKFKH